jgi:Uma2 family endonuclease
MTSPPLRVPPGRPTPPPTPVTFEEFLDWADEDTLAEWVEGEIVPLSPSSLEHQDLLGFLYKLIDGYVGARQLGTVILPPFLMRLANAAEWARTRPAVRHHRPRGPTAADLHRRPGRSRGRNTLG